MSLLRKLVPATRSTQPLPFETFLSWFVYGGLEYPAGFRQTLLTNSEPIPENFEGYARVMYRHNGVVFACLALRALIFSEARLGWLEDREGRPGQMFNTPELGIFEEPWAYGTTGDLLARAILDVDLAGNHFVTVRGTAANPRLKRMRPDWTTLVLGTDEDPRVVVEAQKENSENELDFEIVGLMYQPGGPIKGNDPVPIRAGRFAHFAPYPDPVATYRGVTWLGPVVREVIADSLMTDHKRQFLENGATPNLVVKLDIKEEEIFKRWVALFKEEHEGVENAYKTLFFGAGADPQVVGANLRQLDFKAVQGAGETRVVAAAGLHPVIVGLSEGLQGSSLNAGNYVAARRRVADATFRPLWRNLCGSFSQLVQTPDNSKLWYWGDIPFLQEDQKDEAEIQRQRAESINSFISTGFTADSAVEAVVSGDLTRLKHTGLYSVQLVPALPGTQSQPQQQEALPAEQQTAVLPNGQGRAIVKLVDGRALLVPIGKE